MALENANVTLLSGQAAGDIYDLFIATMSELPVIGDEISEYVPLFDILKKKGLIKKVGAIGVYIPIALMDEDNPTIQWISGYDAADRTPTKVLSEGRAQYGHLHGSLVTNREEQIKNSGRHQLIDLIETKRKQLKIGLAKALETGLFGTQEADGKNITGLGRIMDETATLHGLAPATYDFWVPTRVYSSGTTNFVLSSAFRAGMRKLFRTVSVEANNLSPNIVICGEDVFDAAWSHAESKLQITQVSQLSSAAAMAVGGDVMFESMGRVYLYSDKMAAKEAWATNWQEGGGLELRAHRDTYFSQGPWLRDPSKVQTLYSDNLTYLSLFCSNRKAQGRIVFT